ncbi:MAG: aminoglycoside phosphotransferase family protein [Streptomycetaceae bacterium]|nr:aminoglycoside phosphotransferase family protein [Streptomycetaceae bacterium]
MPGLSASADAPRDVTLRGVTAPVPRLDPYAAIDRIADDTGVRLRYDGPCSGGEVGAAYVRWPDGTRSVLTSGRPASAALVQVARAAGVPAPDYLLCVGDLVVQELLSGVPPTALDEDVLAQLLAVHDRFAGLLPGGPAPRESLPDAGGPCLDDGGLPSDASGPLELFLRRSGPGFCVHETLAAYDTRTRALLARVREAGEERDVADGDDLVHVDFHAGNTLFDRGALTGVVDWDGAGRGDRAFDLVTLRFDVALRSPALLPILDERLAALAPDRLRAYWAHMSLRLVDWAIRHHGPDEVRFWLRTAADCSMGSA